MSDTGSPVAPGAAQPEPPVLTAKRGRLGHIILNRPRAINALTLQMVGIIQATLDEWVDDDEVQTVLVTGSGHRGLCAGGDIVAIYDDAKTGGTGSIDFWRQEYRLNAAIARYPKPVVAVMNGIVLGGGIGIAAHAAHRVVTETSSVGLPETTIGFVPDVGGTFLLSRAPGRLGTHLAMTAGSAGPGDSIDLGLADHFITDARIPQLVSALETSDPVEAVLLLAEPAPPGDLLRQRAWIDPAYSAGTAAEIVHALVTTAGPHAAEAAAAAESIEAKSPFAVTAALASIRRATEVASLEAALAQEFRVSVRMLGVHDLAEGIRAQVIDKDRNPHWSPDSLEAVDPAAVNALFEPLPIGELWDD